MEGVGEIKGGQRKRREIKSGKEINSSMWERGLGWGTGDPL